MDCQKVGELILYLRKERNLTQKQLAETMNISDKTISKWERGLGLPDVSLLPELSNILGVDIEKILIGNLNPNAPIGGNMKKTKFYVCLECGNIITSSGEVSVSCCGRKLDGLSPVKADDFHKLEIEDIENEWFISSQHEMTKEHFVSFIVYANEEKLLLSKHYPEWDLQVRLPKLQRGILYFFCTQHKLYYQVI